jgi:hypothetical protein
MTSQEKKKKAGLSFFTKGKMRARKNPSAHLIKSPYFIGDTLKLSNDG